MSDNNARYISGAEWARIQAKAWIDKDFYNALELDPINTIKNDPQVGVQFDRMLNLPCRPSDISDEKLASIASGKEEAVMIPYTCICF